MKKIREIRILRFTIFFATQLKTLPAGANLGQEMFKYHINTKG